MSKQSTPLTRLIHSAAIAAIAAGSLLGASVAHAGKGHPVCLYLYEKAGEQKIKSERSCVRWGGHGINGVGGDEKKFRDKYLKKAVPHFDLPVQYIGLKAGWGATVWYENASGALIKTKITQDGPIDIRRGKLRGVWAYELNDKVGGYPVCVYTSRHDMKAKKDGLCLRYGEYTDIRHTGWDTLGKRVDFVDLRDGYMLEMYPKAGWRGGQFRQTKDGRLPKEIRNQVRSMRVVKIP
ncbi:hypothetical protein [Denitromonas ohlonensis]|uniref:Uncharacterized protein n=2 Tax=Denitromonas TaxID=139331 RepID=A0A557RTF5_9RHOO|nr:hypothetical protein [Denitromonas ohlonensis]TVO68425.1 hypothetical protein FHP90_03870 [Denitromonas ohlonensis]TVO74703.1 hypothetical protein FHP89_15420 [Denitromonas ohlonensis]